MNAVDLVIQGGIDINGNSLEVAITNGIITQIGPKLDVEAKEVISLEENTYISAGWIDSHVHCYEAMDLYYDFPDEIGVLAGVTTVVDAGSSGEANIKDFYERTRKAKTNVYALMNISKNGIVTQDELADLRNIDNDINELRIRELKDFIVGIKARMSKTVVGDNDTIPLKMAKELQHRFENLPLMVHIGSRPPRLEDIFEICEAGDIITHCYNGKENGIVSPEGKIKPFVWDAYRKGLLFDIGHGTDSFNFKVAHQAFDEGVLCNTISSDIYYRNRINGPVYDLATTMEKGLEMGLSLEQVIEMVTVHPARMYHLDNKGELLPGKDADLSLFKIIEAKKTLKDSNGNESEINQTIVPVMAVVGGKPWKVV